MDLVTLNIQNAYVAVLHGQAALLGRALRQQA